MTSARPLGRRIGISQGRLVPSATGELQCSPGTRWREEFEIAGRIELSHIELLAERTPDPTNPIWSAGGRHELAEVARATGVATASLCTNETLNRSFDDVEVALDAAARLAPAVRDLGVAVVVVSMLEASDLRVLDLEGAARAVRAFAERLDDAGAEVVLEVGVPAVELVAFLESTGCDRIGVCYDLGNATALGFDTAAELRLLGDRVWHVHAKDKDVHGQNVRFGTGEVAFAAAFAQLAAAGFDGLVTMESTRGDDPAVTAAEHRSFLLSLASR